MLAVAGDLDVDETLALIEKHFGGITKRRTPKRPNFAEPALTAERRETHHDAHAPIPAVAIGYRVPDPVRELDDHLAHVLLAEVLTDGDASRLQRRLVQRDHLVTDIAAYIGEFGDPFDERDPTALTISAHYPDADSLDAILRAIDEELDRIADDGLEAGRARPGAAPPGRRAAARARSGHLAHARVRQVRVDLRTDRDDRRAARPARGRLRGRRAPSRGRRCDPTDEPCSNWSREVPDERATRSCPHQAAARAQAQRRRAHHRQRPAHRRRAQAGRAAGRDAAAHPVPRLGRHASGTRGRAGRQRCSPAPGRYDRAGLAAAIQSLGADLVVGVDADRLLFSGNVLATGLHGLLDLLALVLTEPTFAPDEVATRARPRDRAADHRPLAQRGDRRRAARRADVGRASLRPRPAARPRRSRRPRPTQVRNLHRDRVHPDGAVLILVGDVSPKRVLDQAERALACMDGARHEAAHPEAARRPPAGPLLIVDRPGSVQSSLRMATMALTRTDPDYPALQLANLIFGGYFSSRWVENIREDKGYTYGPHSRIDHQVLGSILMLDVEVATEVTAPSLLETHYELGQDRDAAGDAGRGRLGAAVRDRLARAVDGHPDRPGVDAVRAVGVRARARLDHRAPARLAAGDRRRGQRGRGRVPGAVAIHVGRRRRRGHRSRIRWRCSAPIET